MFMCNLKGDTVNDSETAGILGINADIRVRACTLAHFKSGGIMLQCLPQTVVAIEQCTIISCRTNGIYIQGKASRPNILKNKILFCRSIGIKTNLDVDANIRENLLELNDVGIEILNNSSFILDNNIRKMHTNGI